MGGRGLADGERSVKRVSIVLAGLFVLAACSSTPPPATTPPGPKELKVLADSVDGAALLSADAARASVVGAGPVRLVGADVVVEGDRVGAFVEIPDAECVLALSRSSPTVADVDLYAFEDDGSLFASDEAPERDAALLVCPPHPRRLYFSARAMAGSGIVAVGVMSVPRASAETVAKAVNARGGQGEDSGRLEAWPGLEARVRAHRTAIGAKWEDVRRVAVPVGPRAATRVAATIDAGRCVDVLVVPSEEVASLEVVAEDEDARIVARGRDLGRDRSLLFCSAVHAQVSIAIRPRASQGLVAVSVARSAVGAEPEIASGARITHLSPTVELDAAKKDLEKLLASTGYAAPKTLATGSAKIGSRTSVDVSLPDGCVRIDVIGGKPLAGALATLWNDHGGAIAEAGGGSGASIFACGKAGTARLDFEAIVSPGPFAVELRKDASAPPDLVAHPVAAARLLARASSGGDVATAADARDVKVLAVDATTLATLPIAVASGGCTEVIAAIEEGASGLDLRLVDAATGEDTIAHSEGVAADRLCAGAKAVSGRAELRVATGKSSALVLTRPVK